MRLTSSMIAVALLAIGCTEPTKPAKPAADAGAKVTTTSSAPSATPSASATSSASATARVAPPVPEALAKACGGFAQAVCAKLYACNAMTKVLYLSEAQCRERLGTECAIEVTAPDALADAEGVDTCTKKVGAAACADIDPTDLDVCRFKGKRADGAACGSDAQCASGTCDNGAPGEDVRWKCGRCTASAKEGDACAESSACAAGLRCGSGKCAKPVDVGAACDAAHPCKDTASCVAAKCAVFLKAGDKCDPALTSSALCDPARALECDEKSKTCTPATFVEAGGDCGEVAAGSDRLCIGGRCAAGKCAPLAADGAACKTAHDCVVPAYCASGRCALPDPASCK